MTMNTTRPSLDDESDADRIAILRRLFHRMWHVLDKMIDGCEANTDHSPKLLLSKLSELQSVHFAVLKVQETFLEKQNPSPENRSTNVEEIRSIIGSKLDRIRETIASESVSEKP